MADRGLGRTGLITLAATNDNVITPTTSVAFGETTSIATAESTGAGGTTVAAEYWDPATSSWQPLPLGGAGGGTGDALKTETMGVVVHGADATVARPEGYQRVWWYGSVAPDNAGDYDHYTYEAPPS